MVVIGGSGSGKSVLIKCILGLIEPDTGTIEIDGVNVLAQDRATRAGMRQRIGMLFQNGALFDSLPVWENVAFGLLAQKRCSRAAARPLADAVLAQVGLAATRSGSTAIAITHDMLSARRIGDRAAMLHKGRIIWEGEAGELMNTGNAMVDQFTHGLREGPIQMELRKGILRSPRDALAAPDSVSLAQLIGTPDALARPVAQI
eukprot:gene2687-2726_t